MPKKIRELKSLLLQAGFTCRTGKGSHTNWYHPLLSGRVTISGKDGKDAKEYQEKDVNDLKVETAVIKGEIKTLARKVEGMDKRLEKVEDSYAIIVRVG